MRPKKKTPLHWSLRAAVSEVLAIACWGKSGETRDAKTLAILGIPRQARAKKIAAGEPCTAEEQECIVKGLEPYRGRLVARGWE